MIISVFRINSSYKLRTRSYIAAHKLIYKKHKIKKNKKYRTIVNLKKKSSPRLKTLSMVTHYRTHVTFLLIYYKLPRQGY